MAQNQGSSLILVGGSKGGVGKSLVSVALIDWLLCDQRAAVVVVDSDDSNPDVHRVYETAAKAPGYPELTTLNLDAEAGWILLTECCELHRHADIVVNTGGRNITGLLAHAGPFLDAIATELPHRVVMLWVTNGQRDSVALLARYLNERGDDSPITAHVVCNCAEMPDRDFSLYLNSQTAQRVKDTGGRVMVVPTLAKAAADEIYNRRQEIRAIVRPDGQTTLGVRVAMARWRSRVWAGFNTLNPLAP